MILSAWACLKFNAQAAWERPEEGVSPMDAEDSQKSLMGRRLKPPQPILLYALLIDM